jgi:hypothetical protein
MDIYLGGSKPNIKGLRHLCGMSFLLVEEEDNKQFEMLTKGRHYYHLFKMQ